MIHQVVPEGATRTAQTARPDVARRTHEQPGAVERRGTYEEDLRTILRGLVGERIHDTHTGHPFAVLVVHEFVHDGVCLECEIAGFTAAGSMDDWVLK